jgi:hypothetical protein
MNETFKEIFAGFDRVQKLAHDIQKRNDYLSEKIPSMEESKRKPTQTSEVIKHLRKLKTITSKQAFNNFGCTRLSSMILRLRRSGWIIDCIDTEGVNRYGKKTYFGTYVLVNEPLNSKL